MADLGGILGALMSAPQQAAGLLSGILGIPQGQIQNAQGQTVFPTNALERLLQGSDNAAQNYAAAFMGPGVKMMGGGAKITPLSPRGEFDWLTRMRMADRPFGDNSNPIETGMLLTPYDRALILQRQMQRPK